MKINSENKQAIHDVLITDMQKRLYENGKGIMFTNDNEYTSHLEGLVDEILLTQSLNDVNDVVCNNQDLFDDYDSIGICTLEGTMNYIFKLLR